VHCGARSGSADTASAGPDFAGPNFAGPGFAGSGLAGPSFAERIVFTGFCADRSSTDPVSPNPSPPSKTPQNQLPQNQIFAGAVSHRTGQQRDAFFGADGAELLRVRPGFDYLGRDAQQRESGSAEGFAGFGRSGGARTELCEFYQTHTADRNTNRSLSPYISLALYMDGLRILSREQKKRICRRMRRRLRLSVRCWNASTTKLDCTPFGSGIVKTMRSDEPVSRNRWPRWCSIRRFI